MRADPLAVTHCLAHDSSPRRKSPSIQYDAPRLFDARAMSGEPVAEAISMAR